MDFQTGRGVAARAPRSGETPYKGCLPSEFSNQATTSPFTPDTPKTPLASLSKQVTIKLDVTPHSTILLANSQESPSLHFGSRSGSNLTSKLLQSIAEMPVPVPIPTPMLNSTAAAAAAAASSSSQGSNLSSTSTTKKRRRTPQEELYILEESFKKNPTPDGATRAKLSQLINMNSRSVQIWMQNRRQTERRKSSSSSSAHQLSEVQEIVSNKENAAPRSAFRNLLTHSKPPKSKPSSSAVFINKIDDATKTKIPASMLPPPSSIRGSNKAMHFSEFESPALAIPSQRMRLSTVQDGVVSIRRLEMWELMSSDGAESTPRPCPNYSRKQLAKRQRSASLEWTASRAGPNSIRRCSGAGSKRSSSTTSAPPDILKDSAGRNRLVRTPSTRSLGKSQRQLLAVIDISSDTREATLCVSQTAVKSTSQTQSTTASDPPTACSSIIIAEKRQDPSEIPAPKDMMECAVLLLGLAKRENAEL